MIYNFRYSNPKEAPAMTNWLCSTAANRPKLESKLSQGRIAPADYRKAGIRILRNDLQLLINSGAMGQWHTLRYDGQYLAYQSKTHTTKIKPRIIGILSPLNPGDMVIFSDVKNNTKSDIIPHLSLA